MYRLCCLVLCLLNILVSLQVVYATEPPVDPILRIETGAHSVVIKKIDADRSGRFLVTASEDKTVRLWSLSDGHLLKTLRVPIGEGNEGKLYAVAISPQGDWIAAGGETGKDWGQGYSLYLFDRASGRMQRRLDGLPGIVRHLCFSRDGKRLAATFYGKGGMRVWATGSWRQLAADSDYGHHSYWCEFDDSGRLLTSSWDGYLRLYDQTHKLVRKSNALLGPRPFAATFSPNGSRIAVGFDSLAKVQVLSGTDLSPLYQPDTGTVSNGDLAVVAWSADGKSLYAGGMFAYKGITPLLKWNRGGRGRLRIISTPMDNTLMDLRALADGRLLAGFSDPAWLVMDKAGGVQHSQRARIADLRKIGAGLRVSENARQVGFALAYAGKQPVVFDLDSRQLESVDTVQEDLVPPLTMSLGLFVMNWENQYNPSLNGMPLQLQQHDISRSLAINPVGSDFLLGTEWYLHRFDADGRELWRNPAPGAVWGVNISGDGRLAVVTFGDGTVRWFRLDDGRELLALFIDRKTLDWVLWTPGGYYDASPGGDHLIGWHVNNGREQTPDFFPVGQMRHRFYRPEVVSNILSTLDERQALAKAGMKRADSVAQGLPPTVELLNPTDGSGFNQPRISLQYRIDSKDEAPITALRLLVDGRPLEGARGLQRVKVDAQSLQITLPARDLELALIAENRFGSSRPARVRLKWQGATAGQAAQQAMPTLYLLAIGVSDYDNNDLDLNFAAKDARDFTAALQQHGRGLYREVVVKTLADADSDSVLDGLDWLRRKVGSGDVAMLFMAGHGVNDDDGDYYFLTRDADTNRLSRTAIPYFNVKKTLYALAGKALAFIDTCHSGNIMKTQRGVADINAVVNDLSAAENGVVVFAASTGNQYSLEDSAWGNGAFTKALVEGINGKADYTRNGRITINKLDLYLSERVKELTAGRQTPTTAKPQMIADFSVALVR